jgi:dihydroxyacetone kinase-like protein
VDLDVQVFVKWMRGFEARLIQVEDLLNDLDNRIGDGDHGTNMKRGFHAAVEKLESTMPAHVAEAAQVVAMALLGTVGEHPAPSIALRF